jgi:predicted DNA-binding transcriptional regulator AlpA
MSRRLLRLREVLSRTGDSRSGFYRKIRAGIISPGVPINPANGWAKGWPSDEIDAHVEAVISAGRAPDAPPRRPVGRPRKNAPMKEEKETAAP